MEETKESYIRVYLGDFTVIDAIVEGTPIEIEAFIKDKNNKDAFLPTKGKYEYVDNDIISIPVEVLWKNIYTLSEKREFIIKPQPPI